MDEGKKRGYRHFNIKVAPDPDFDVALAREVRRLAPETFLWADANGGIAPPTIGAATLGSVSVVGTACPVCTVELFENDDDDGEGETYIGDAVAAATGTFTVTVASLGKPYLTATATHPLSGTSEFSGPFVVSLGRLCLPIVLSDH